MNILLKIIEKPILALSLRFNKFLAKIFFYKEVNIFAAINEFKKYNQSSLDDKKTRQPHKNYEIYKYIVKNNINIKKFYELGSGTTTVLFAYLSYRLNFKFTCFEHSKYWHKITYKILKKHNLITKEIEILYIKKYHNKINNELGYSKLFTSDTDVIYVDGPPANPELSKNKVERYYNINNLLERKILPKLIIVDGRHKIVSILLSSLPMNRYSFTPSTSYKKIIQKEPSFYFREHSYFLLKD